MSFLASRWVRAIVSIGLLAIVIRLADWREILTVMRDLELKWLWAAAALAAVDRILLTHRWHVLLVARGLQISFTRLFRIQLAANFFGSFLPGSLGVDAIRITALCNDGHPAPLVLAATLVDRASLMLATLLFGSGIVLVLAGQRLPQELSSWILWTTAGVAILCAMALAPAARAWIKYRCVARLPERFRVQFSDIAMAALAYRKEYGRIALVTGVTLTMFIVRLLFAQTLALACGANVSFVDLLLVIPVLWIIVMLPITVGNIGLQDAGYVALLALVGVPAAVAVSMSIAEHVITRLVALPGVLFLADVSGGSQKAKPV